MARALRCVSYFCYSPKDSVLKGADSIIEKAQFTFVKGHDGDYKKIQKIH